MHEHKHYSQAAHSYARAVIELAEEQKLSIEALGSELTELAKMVETDNTFRLYLADPSISGDRRWELLKRVLENRVSPVMLHLVGVLSTKNRLSILREVAGAYQELLDERLGKVEVDITVAHKLTPEQIEDARKRVSAALGRDAIIHIYVDDNIIGGMLLRIGDKLIDASVKRQLQSIKEKLMSARPQ